MELHEQTLGRESDRVLRWRQALTELANIQGFSYSACQYRNQGPESELIDLIVEDVLRRLGVEQLFVANPPVGTKSQVHEQKVELFDYDVFLSFRGEDTGHGFTSYLYSALGRSGIHAFMDNTENERGELISPSLLQVIERSRLALVVLSPNYASSGRCLEQLVEILRCEHSNAQLVIPIFYEVDSYDVRNQRGTYDETMKQHEQRLGRKSERVWRWRMALNELASIQGFCFSGGQNRNQGPESELIGIIVEDLSRKLGDRLLFATNHPVGIESRVQEQTFERFHYDVCLSYRAEDTGRGFTSHLYNALKKSGIHVFMENTGIETGNFISRSTVQGIHESRIALIIFSLAYASSAWCLEDMIIIMNLKKSLGQVVIPIFYKVDPSDVRHQRGTCGEAMEQHEQRWGRESDKVLRWRQALTELADFQGFSYRACQYRNQGPESELIGIIVEDVSRKLSDRLLFAANHPVGIESRVQEQTFERFNYDVFLSYRGEDTGRGFTSHLYNAMRQIGIHAFMVDTGIETGDWVIGSLVQVIKGSRIAIIILSLAYASSVLCLKELVEIMKQRAYVGKLVTPIFYKVDPSNVRHQRGTYGEAMEHHERLGGDSEQVLQWRQALTELTDIEGFSFSASQYRNEGPESKLIENIVGDVSRKLGREELFVADHSVGQVHELTTEWLNYHVFLSFRGEDTGNGFTSHLYNALRWMGIHAFMDNAMIPKEEEIPGLLHVIERSQIVVVILSSDYASSTSCLDELMKIMECQGTLEHQVVMPIFYEVDPSDVRNQRGSYGEAMKLHEQRLGMESDWVSRSRKALETATNKAGFDSSAYRTESELIEKIVGDVRKKLDDN